MNWPDVRPRGGVHSLGAVPRRARSSEGASLVACLSVCPSLSLSLPCAARVTDAVTDGVTRLLCMHARGAWSQSDRPRLRRQPTVRASAGRQATRESRSRRGGGTWRGGRREAHGRVAHWTAHPPLLGISLPQSPTRSSLISAMSAPAVAHIGNASDFEYSLTCLGAGYVGGPTMVSDNQANAASQHHSSSVAFVLRRSPSSLLTRFIAPSLFLPLVTAVSCVLLSPPPPPPPPLCVCRPSSRSTVLVSA